MNQYPHLHDLNLTEEASTGKNNPISRINLRMLSGDSYTFQVNFETETIRHLLEELEKRLQFNMKNIKLIYKGKTLQNIDRTLQQYNVGKQQSIFVLLKPNSVLNTHNFQRGLNLENFCQFCNQRVYVPFGMGIFNIGKIIFECRCPKCNKLIARQADNFGFFQTRYKILAKKDSQRKGFVHDSEVSDGQYHPYFQQKQAMDHMNYIQVNTYQL